MTEDEGLLGTDHIVAPNKVFTKYKYPLYAVAAVTQ
jgi:hypothetical protein